MNIYTVRYAAAVPYLCGAATKFIAITQITSVGCDEHHGEIQ